jgi:MFS family permease
MFYDIGHGIGPVTAGFLIPHIGYRGMYSVMALISLSCILFYYFLHGKKAARLAHLPVEVQARGES